MKYITEVFEKPQVGEDLQKEFILQAINHRISEGYAIFNVSEIVGKIFITFVK